MKGDFFGGLPTAGKRWDETKREEEGRCDDTKRGQEGRCKVFPRSESDVRWVFAGIQRQFAEEEEEDRHGIIEFIYVKTVANMVILHESLFKELGWDDGYAVPAANEFNQRLQHQFQKKQEELQRLQEELGRLEGRLKSLQDHEKRLLERSREGELEREHEALRTLEAELQKLKSGIVDLEKEDAHLHERSRRHEDASSRYQERLGQAQTELQLDQITYEEWLRELGKKNSDSLALVKYAHIDEGKIRDVSLELEKKETEVDQERRKVEGLETEIIALLQSREKTLRLARDRDQELKEAGSRWHEATKNLHLRNHLLQQALQELGEKEEERKKLNAKREMEEEYTQRERGNNIELARRLEGDLKPRQAKIKQALEDKKTRKQDLVQQMAVSQNALAGARRDLDALRVVNKKMEEEQRMTEKKSKRVLEEIREIEEKKKTWEHNASDADKRFNLFLQLIQEEEGRGRGLERSMALALALMARREKELKEKEKKKEEITRRVTGIQTQITATHAQATALEQDIAAREDAIYKMKGKREAEKGQEQMERMKEEVNSLEGEYASMLRTLNSLKERRDGGMMERSLLEVEVQRVSRRLQELSHRTLQLEKDKIALQTEDVEMEKMWEGEMEQLRGELRLVEGDATRLQTFLNDRLLRIQRLSKRKEVVLDGLSEGKEVDVEVTPGYLMVKRVQEKGELLQDLQDAEAELLEAREELQAALNTLHLVENANHRFKESYVSHGRGVGPEEEEEEEDDERGGRRSVMEGEYREAAELEREAQHHLDAVNQKCEEVKAQVMEVEKERVAEREKEWESQQELAALEKEVKSQEHRREVVDAVLRRLHRDLHSHFQSAELQSLLMEVKVREKRERRRKAMELIQAEAGADIAVWAVTERLFLETLRNTAKENSFHRTPLFLLPLPHVIEYCAIDSCLYQRTESSQGQLETDDPAHHDIPPSGLAAPATRSSSRASSVSSGTSRPRALEGYYKARFGSTSSPSAPSQPSCSRSLQSNKSLSRSPPEGSLQKRSTSSASTPSRPGGSLQSSKKSVPSAVNDSEREMEGKVSPRACDRRISREDLEFTWFHGKVSREMAETRLLSNDRNCDEGTFLVRESNSSSGDYVLSLVNSGKVVHFQIRQMGDDAFYAIDEGPVIHGLDTLIQYYQEDDHGLPFKLGRMCIGMPPPHDTRKHGRTNLLHRAAKEGDLRILQEVINSGYHSLEAKNQDGQTALHLAVIHGHVSVAKFLLQVGAPCNVRDSVGLTPLHYACRINQAELVSQLMDHGANPQVRSSHNNEVALQEAAKVGAHPCIEALLKGGAPIRPRTLDSLTPSDIAREEGHLDCLRLLGRLTG
ncbi:unnamed protein product [Darwinula stevensoni]|uniref:Coiled-coil domain-containing protein 39 n=1 Tax=Darwinula stevensoni TaxID=69355 RepID=A0A7R8X115_9CRUS|nr:unnamed protein product [Darwinula stevensoni]CAG0882307.1 unnamed protein product [Darwinula stevensoni]